MLAIATWWLVVSVLMMTLASIKLNAPGFLGAFCFLSYGRLQPAALNALVLGFCVPIGHAVAVWGLFASTGARLPWTGVMLASWAVWNVGLLIGTIGILRGDGTGIEWLELPGYASRMLIVSIMIFTVWVLRSVWRGCNDRDDVRLWCCVGVLLLFPWIYGAGLLGSVYGASRGVLSAITQAWFVQMLLVVWGGVLGLGVLRSRSAGAGAQTLASDRVARFAFWTLGLFGGVGAFQRLQGGPFPAWMIAIGNASAVLCLLPLCAVLASFRSTFGEQCGLGKLIGSRALLASAFGFYGLALVLATMSCFHSVACVVQFTTYRQAIDMSLLTGFLVPSLLLAVHRIMPLHAGLRWPEHGLQRAVFLTMAGGTLIVAGLVIGGVVQGVAWNDPVVPVADVVRLTGKWLGVTMAGWILVFCGIVWFAINVCMLIARGFRLVLWPEARAWFQADIAGKEPGA
ncbi:MAG: hypothetical protein ACP5MD_04710 [Verrucomicrobiia bacterium]